MSTEFPSAAEMRAKLDSNLSAEAQTQLARLKTEMETAVARGQDKITVWLFAYGVEDRLRKAGYKVVRHAAQGDPREPNNGGGAYWTVSW